MINTHAFFRHPESLREKRLIFQQQMKSPEAEPKLRSLLKEDATDKELEDAVEEASKSGAAFEAFVGNKALDVRQQELITKNLERARSHAGERVDEKAKATSLIERQKKVFGPSKAPSSSPSDAAPQRQEAPAPKSEVPTPKAEVPAPKSETPASAPSPATPNEKGFVESSLNKAREYWDSASPEVKAVSAGAAVAIVAYGAWKLMGWLWGGTKKVTEKAKEKTEAGMGWFAKTIIAGSLLAVAGVAGYIGVRKLQDYLSTMATDIKNSVKEHADAAKQKVKEVTAEARAEISEHGRAAAEKVQNAAHAGAAKLKEKKEGATAKDIPAKAEAYAPGAAVFLLSKYLQNGKVADAYEALKGKKLGEILTAYDPAKKTTRPEKLKEFSVVPKGASEEEAGKYEEAAQKLITFCGDRSREAKVLHDTSRKPGDPPFEDLTLEQYVLSLGGGLSLAADAVEFSHDLSGWKPDASLLKRIKDGSLSVGRKVRDLGVEHLSHLHSSLQEIEIKEVLKHLAEEEGGVFAQRSVRSVLSDVRLTEAQISALPPEKQREARIHALVLEICERALPTGHELAPFFHRTFPDRAWSNDMAANEKVVEQYVQEMSVAQALRFFSYWQMLKSRSQEEQVGGIVALQYEVLRLIDKRDAGYFGGFIKPKFKSAVVGLTEDLASPAFGEALAEVAKVDASIVSRVCEMLQEPAKRMGYYAGLAALGPVKYLAEWGLGAWEKHPVAAPLVAGTAAYALVSPVRLTTNAPFKFGWWWYTRKDPGIAASALKNPWQRFNPFRRSYGLLSEGAHYIARKEAGNFLSRMLEQIHSIPDAAARTEIQSALETCLRNGAQDVHLRDFQRTVQHAWQRLGKPHYLGELRNLGHSLAYENGFANAREALRLYARPFREQIAGLRFVREMRAAGLGGTMLWGAGLAAQGYAAYEDWKEVGKLSDQKKEVRTHGVDALTEVRQKLEQDGRYQMSSDGRSFVHKESGVVVDLKVSERQLTNAEGALNTRMNAQIGRAATSTGAFIGLALMGPRLAMGPAGLAVVGVELVIRGGIAAIEQSKMRKFIENSPPWILAALGLQETTGTSEQDWLNGASSWMISDVLWLGSNDANKEKIRDRVLFTIFCRDLKQYVPEVLGEMLDGVDTPDHLDAFFGNDFRSLVLPYFSIALFARAGGDMGWSNARSVDTDSGWLVVPPRATLLDIRRAMREASVFYLQHVREQRYLKLLACRQRLTDEGLGEQWEQAMAQVGGVAAFGQILRDSALKGTEQKTRAELLLQNMRERLERTPGDTRAAKLQSNPNLFAVSASEVPGLPALSLKNPEILLSSIGDPALRERLRQIYAESTEEQEARVYHNPYEVFSAEAWKMPSGLDAGTEHLAFIQAANNVLQGIGAAQLPENASKEVALQNVTAGLVTLAQTKPRHVWQRDRLEQWLNKDQKHQPLVFASNTQRHALMSADPHTADAELSRDRLVAVSFEGFTLAGSFDASLATYVYGDPSTFASENPVLFVVQRGAATSHPGRTTSFSCQGMNHYLSGQEFLKQQGAREMLAQIAQAWGPRKAHMQAQEQREAVEKKQREDAEQRKATEWKEASSRAHERAKAQLETWHAMPSPSSSMRGTPPYDYVAYMPSRSESGKGTFLYLQLPNVTQGPTMRAAGGTVEGEAVGKADYVQITAIEEGKESGHRWAIDGAYLQRMLAQKEVAEAGVIRLALAMPVAGNDTATVRKIIAPYVRDPSSEEVRNMEEEVIALLKQCPDEQHRRVFLRELGDKLQMESTRGMSDNQFRALGPSLLKKSLDETRRFIGGTSFSTAA